MVSRKKALMPAGARIFLQKCAFKVAGATLIALGILIVLALGSYDAFDPSWNTSVISNYTNLAGKWGAIFADVSLQLFGLGAFIIPLTLLITGWRLMHRREPLRFLKISLETLALLVLASVVFALVPGIGDWTFGHSLGGLLGFAWLETWSYWITLSKPAIATLTSILLLFVLLLMGTLHTFYITIKKVYATLSTWRRRRQAMSIDKSQSMDEKHAAPFLENASPWQLTTHPEDHPIPKSPKLKSVEVPLRARMPTPTSRNATDNPKLFVKTSGTDSSEIFLPPLDLLQDPPKRTKTELSNVIDQSELLSSVLEEFGIRGRIVNMRPGPVVSLYELEPSAGMKSSRVIGLADDIARSMCAISARVSIIPGRNAIGIELPNPTRQVVYLKELLTSDAYERSTAILPLVLGKDIGGAPVIADLAKMPHLLLAGTTGSGKSVAINTMILSLLYQLPASRCKLIMVDPKMLELSIYDGIPHLLAPVVTDPKKAVVALKWVVREMEERYRAMSSLGVRNIEGYNQKLQETQRTGAALNRRVQTGFDPETGKPIFESQPLDLKELPYIVVIVDEMADLMLVAGKDIEGAVQRLAQMARAAGIHLIMATQRPSVDVITGTIKANFPCRISFQVTSKIDSRTILGEQGAEQLLGQGDMLYMASASRVTRVHGPFVSDQEVEAVVQTLKRSVSMVASPQEERIDFDHEEDLDEETGGKGSKDLDALFDQAVALICRDKKASTSYIQRHFQIGYNRAARIMEQMETEGIVSPANHVGKREIFARTGE